MLTRVKMDSQGFVAGALCDCGGRLAYRDASTGFQVVRQAPDYVCIRCYRVVPARRVFLAINARVVH